MFGFYYQRGTVINMILTCFFLFTFRGACENRSWSCWRSQKSPLSISGHNQ